MSIEDQVIMEEQMVVLRTQKPYLINALRQWAMDKGARPHVLADSTWPGVTGVPSHLIHPQLVLNVSDNASTHFQCDEAGITVGLTFSGVHRQLFLPIAAIRAIYAPELGNVGMSFDSFNEVKPEESDDEPAVNEEAPKERPSFLSIVK